MACDRYRNGVGTHTEVLDAEAPCSLTDYNHLNALLRLPPPALLARRPSARDRNTPCASDKTRSSPPPRSSPLVAGRLWVA